MDIRNGVLALEAKCQHFLIFDLKNLNWVNGMGNKNRLKCGEFRLLLLGQREQGTFFITNEVFQQYFIIYIYNATPIINDE